MGEKWMPWIMNIRMGRIFSRSRKLLVQSINMIFQEDSL